MRGRLPDPDRLSVSEMGAQWAEAEASRACWRRGYFALIGVVDAGNEAWRSYGDDRAR